MIQLELMIVALEYAEKIGFSKELVTWGGFLTLLQITKRAEELKWTKKQLVKKLEEHTRIF